jgi:hypothetical protein
MGELGMEANLPERRTQEETAMTPLEHHLTNLDYSNKLKSSCELRVSREPPTPPSSPIISVALPSSLTSSSSGIRATASSCHDISRETSVESLLVGSMDFEGDDVHDSQTNFLYVDGYFASRSRTESTYLRPDELPPCKDEDTPKFRNEAMVYVTDILSSEAKTSQGLIDDYPNMLLLRALFDVPKASDDYKSITRWVMTLFQTSNKLMRLMQVAVRQEVQCTCIDALFREDTMVCTLASSFLKWAGGAYLRQILGPVISKIAQSKKSFEIDLNKGGAKGNEKRVRKLVAEILKGIFESSSSCPLPVREFLFYMRSEIRDKHPQAQADNTICAFFFLRFVCPTIVNPRENGAINKFPTEEAKRGLLIAARIVQTLANDGDCDPDKPYLDKINKLINDNRPNMRKYIEGLSNKSVITKETAQESITNSLSRKLAIEELQKYMYHKIKSLPVNPTPEERAKNEAVMKLRRALQVCTRNNNLTRTTSSPSGSPSHFTNRLLMAECSPSKRHSYVDVFHSSE